MKLTFLVVLAITLLYISCDREIQSLHEYDDYVKHYEELPENEVNRLLRKVIDHSGGWEAYCNIKGLDYKKTIEKIDSSGEISNTIIQHHQYNLFPEFGVRMSWEEGGDEYLILNNSKQSWKLKNGELLTDSQNKNSAYNSSFGSQYVLGMPWKLADPGAKLEYIPLTKLPFNKEAVGIKINYTEENSTTTEHTWWYYFDEKSGKLVASFLKSPQSYSYTEYKDFTKVGDILLHSKRESYSSDSTRENLILRTIYTNNDIKLVPSFPKEKFHYVR